MNKKMRSGITTGTCAAAATKAALLAWQGQPPSLVEITTPQGVVLKVKIASCAGYEHSGQASVIKDAGDDPDITNGLLITALVNILDKPTITIKAGSGVGTVTKPGLAVPMGEPAINPGPQKMIIRAVRDVHPSHLGVNVTISIPDGEKLAKRTLNPMLGVVGGLSIIGTTGIVEPMSEDAFKNSLTPQISVVKALGYDDIIFVPGKIGQNIAINRCNLPSEVVVQTSNFIGHMLESAAHYKMKRVLLFGHLGKLVKVAAGIFHTHNRVADARLETLAAYMAANGAPREAILEILECTTTEAAMPVISKYSMQSVYNVLATRASVRSERYVFGDFKVGTVIVTLSGEILGLDDTAREIGGSLGWNIL
ncbi:MAG: cobalt-precorrin-5B (C(1))-methyltransferase CbiD [Negativicutes bacterium]|nr:cobalt-precorrin-5B (C(1))-methyltransferase CbiD [Negativicutes bacterium]